MGEQQSGEQKRPQYQTSSDLRNEQRAVPAIESALRGEARKLPRNHFADFVVVGEGGGILSYVEYKRRKFKWGAYPTILLSATKFLKLRSVSGLRVRSFFVVEDDDGDIRALELTRADLDFTVEYGGRTAQTRDPRDIEPVVHLGCEQFRRIS